MLARRRGLLLLAALLPSTTHAAPLCAAVDAAAELDALLARAALSGEWQGWIRKDLGLPPLPVTHRGRLTKWCAFLCSKVRARQPHRLVLGARCREVCLAPAATHARAHARTQSSSGDSPRVNRE